MVAALGGGNVSLFTKKLPQEQWEQRAEGTEYTQTLEEAGLLTGPEYLYLVTGDKIYTDAGIHAFDIDTDGKIRFSCETAVNTATVYIIRLELTT